jgi:hypothetical protein
MGDDCHRSCHSCHLSHLLIHTQHNMPDKRSRSSSPSEHPPHRLDPHARTTPGYNTLTAPLSDNVACLTSTVPPTPETSTSTPPKTISDLFPLQEIFLRILSFLSPSDLAVVQGVDRYWARMSLDPQVSRRRGFQDTHRYEPDTERLGLCFFLISYGNTCIYVRDHLRHGHG